jgi:hypothetical protein
MDCTRIQQASSILLQMLAMKPTENIAMELTLLNDDDGPEEPAHDPTPQSQREMYNDKGSTQEPGEAEQIGFTLNGPTAKQRRVTSKICLVQYQIRRLNYWIGIPNYGTFR